MNLWIAAFARCALAGKLRQQIPESPTRITLRHTDIPVGQGEMYREGWLEYYFEPMQQYFRAGS